MQGTARPRFSVVIPAFNSAATIAPTIESVARQTCDRHSVELVVVDDGSGDDTAEVAAELAQRSSLAHQILRTPNRGVSMARNFGAEHARGTWLIFLDHDDALHRRRLEWQAAVCDSAPPRSLIYSPWQLQAESDSGWVELGGVRDVILSGEPRADLLRAESFIHLGCVTLRREEFLSAGGFDPEFRIVQDSELMHRLLRLGWQFRRVPTPEPVMYFRRPRQPTASTRSYGDFLLDCRALALRVAAWAREDGLWTPYFRTQLLQALLIVARGFAGRDWARFEETVQAIEACGLAPLPAAPRALRLLTLAVGYRRAERAAVWYGHLKRRLRGAAPGSSATT